MRRVVLLAILIHGLLPLVLLAAAGTPGYIVVYQQEINGTIYTIAEAPDGVIANNTNATLALASAVSYANNNQLDIAVKPGTYDLYPVGTTPGLYKYPYAIWINTSGIHIYADPNAIFVLHDEAAIVLGSDVQGIRVSDIGWHGGVIDGSKANYTKTHGVIVVFQADYYVVEDATIENAPVHGIHVLMSSSHGIIEGNILVNITGQAITLDGGDYTLVKGNSIHGAAVGVNMQVNSDFEANGGDGVPEKNVVMGNRVEDVVSGIAVMGGALNTITSNTLHANISRAAETYGVVLGAYYSSTLGKAWGPHHNTVTGNIVAGARYAITLKGYPNLTKAVNNIVAGNVVTGYYYVLVKYAENNTIGPNVVDVTSTTPIILGDGAVNNYIAEWNIYESQADVILPQPDPVTVTLPERYYYVITQGQLAQPTVAADGDPGGGGIPFSYLGVAVAAAAILGFLIAKRR